MIKIPPQNKWFQSNRGNIFGSIWSSMGIDLTHQKDRGRGKLRLARMLRGATSGSLTNLTVPVAFRRYGAATYAVGGTRLFAQGAAFTSAWSEVASTPTNFSPRFSDMEVFNGFLYISEGTDDDIARYDGSTWTEIAVGEIGASEPHPLCVYANRLYVGGVLSGNSIIKSMNTSQTVTAVGGANTVTITDALANTITFIRPVSNGIWIGTVNTRGGKGHIYFWDGAQSSGINNSYRLQSAGALAGVVKDDVLYVVDADGRLLAFNGGTFVEIDRLPIRENYLTFAIGEYNERFIHPNGMTVADDRILLLIENQYYIGALNGTIEENCPSGIWEWSKETGLYHKYGLSNTPLSGAGGGTLVDYGQNRIVLSGAGALAFIKQEATPANDNGSLFAGARIYTTASASIYGIFIDDLNNAVQKFGYIITPWIYSDELEDMWQKLFIRHKKLLNSTDKIIVKYRVDDESPAEATVTWMDTNTFTSTDADFANYVAGDEVEVLQGDGAGKCAHISSISEAGGTYTVNLDDTFSGVTTNTAIVRMQKWIKIRETSNQSFRYTLFGIGTPDTRIQLKIAMQFTDANSNQNEIDDLILINNTQVPAK